MRYEERAPPRDLARVVACFWVLDSQGEGALVLPDGSSDFIFERTGRRRATAIGAMTRAIRTAPSRDVVVGVRFQPGAAASFFETSARDLRDAAAPLGDVLGTRGRDLEARVADAADTNAAILALEASLRAARPRARPLDSRVQAALARIAAVPAESSVEEIAAQMHLGARQLERLFDERVGVGPKTFARTVRVQRALRVATTTRTTLAAVAARSGYFDQSHMIREVQALAGLSPREFRRLHAAAADAAIEMSETSNRAREALAMVAALSPRCLP